jgi:tetratricopeptide (TPR) repeat protein
LYHKALALDETLLRLEPASVSRRRNLVVDHVQIGQATERAADPAGALEHYRQALPIIESLSAEDPANMQARSDLASVCQRIGTLLVRGGDPRGAAPFLERSLRLLADVTQKDPASVLTRARVSDTNNGLGHVHAALGAEETLGRDERAGHYRKAKNYFAKSLAFWTEAVERGLATGEENAKPEMLAREIAACDRAIAALAVEKE